MCKEYLPKGRYFFFLDFYRMKKARILLEKSISIYGRMRKSEKGEKSFVFK